MLHCNMEERQSRYITKTWIDNNKKALKYTNMDVKYNGDESGQGELKKDHTTLPILYPSM